MNIVMPETDERKKSIDAILDIALPEKKSLPAEIVRLFSSIRLKNVFAGVGDAVVVSLMISFCVMVIVSWTIASNLNPPVRYNYLHAIIPLSNDISILPFMLTAPVLYFTVLFFSEWKERITGTWEVLKTCRYDLKYITSMRIIIVTFAGLILITLSTLPLIQFEHYLKILLSAFFAFFLYHVIALVFLLISESFSCRILAPVCWLIGWGVLHIIFGASRIELFFYNAPIMLITCLTCLFIAIFILELRVFILRLTRRVGHVIG